MPASLYPLPRTGLGQDSHRFVDEANPKSLVLGGLVIPEGPGLLANSDGDVLLHALCNAISSVTTVPILGAKADDMCRAGVTDSSPLRIGFFGLFYRRQETQALKTYTGYARKYR